MSFPSRLQGFTHSKRAFFRAGQYRNIICWNQLLRLGIPESGL